MSPQTKADRASRARSDWPKRVLFVYFGAVLPLVYIARILADMGPDWSCVSEPGNVLEFAPVMVTRGPILPMCPLLLYSMTCLTLLVVAPERFVKRFVVRFGVYTGVLLAVQYLVVYVVAIVGCDDAYVAVPAAILLVGTPLSWFLVWLDLWFYRRLGMVIISLAGAPLLLLVSITGAPSAVPDFISICLILTPPWAVSCYANLAVYAARHNGVTRMQFSLKQLLAAATWAAAFCGAWRLSVIWMLGEHAQLPTTIHLTP